MRDLDLEPENYRVKGRKEPILHPQWKNGWRPAVALLLLSAALSGCASTTPHVGATQDDAAFAKLPYREQAAEMLGWDGLSYSQKQVIIETARNQGCFGKPQPQEVVIR